MKRLTSILFLLALCLTIKADPGQLLTARLDPYNMTTAQRLALTTLPPGLMVYDTTLGQIMMYTNGVWGAVQGGGGGGGVTSTFDPNYFSPSGSGTNANPFGVTITNAMNALGASSSNYTASSVSSAIGQFSTGIASQLGAGVESGGAVTSTNGLYPTGSGLTNYGLFPSFVAGYTPDYPAQQSVNITNRPNGNPYTTSFYQSYGYGYDFVHNTQIVNFFDNWFWTFTNNANWPSNYPLTVLHSNNPTAIAPANFNLGSFCFTTNGFPNGCLKILGATNWAAGYLDQLYVPSLPECIISVDPVTFASNAPTINIGGITGPTNSVGVICSNALIGFCYAPDNTIWAEFQAQWDAPNGTPGYTAQPTVGRFYPTNCLLHFSATGQQLGIFNHNLPLMNCQGLGYCVANNTLYAIGNDMSSSANWYEGGSLCLFQVTLAGRVAEVVRCNVNLGNAAGPVPNSLSFPYPSQPYLAAFNLMYNTSNNVILYYDVSGTNSALNVDAMGFVNIGQNGLAFPNGSTLKGKSGVNTTLDLPSGYSFVVSSLATFMQISPSGFYNNTGIIGFGSDQLNAIGGLSVGGYGITSTGSIVGPIATATNIYGAVPLFGPTTNDGSYLVNLNASKLIGVVTNLINSGPGSNNVDRLGVTNATIATLTAPITLLTGVASNLIASGPGSNNLDRIGITNATIATLTAPITLLTGVVSNLVVSGPGSNNVDRLGVTNLTAQTLTAPANGLTGALPAISGAALTGLTAGQSASQPTNNNLTLWSGYAPSSYTNGLATQTYVNNAGQSLTNYAQPTNNALTLLGAATGSGASTILSNTGSAYIWTASPTLPTLPAFNSGQFVSAGGQTNIANGASITNAVFVTSTTTGTETNYGVYNGYRKTISTNEYIFATNFTLSANATANFFTNTFFQTNTGLIRFEPDSSVDLMDTVNANMYGQNPVSGYVLGTNGQKPVVTGASVAGTHTGISSTSLIAYSNAGPVVGFYITTQANSSSSATVRARLHVVMVSTNEVIVPGNAYPQQ